MALILRIDVDKPYGRNNIIQKAVSKIREDYFFPAAGALGYLHATHSFAEILGRNQVPAIFYFRNCTAPRPNLARRFLELGHAIGFHAEDTRDFSSFRGELNRFQERLDDLKIHSYTKHGSGQLKLGRHHYPPYEEDKYRDWSERLGLPFLFGNGMLEANDAIGSEKFFPKMFWIEDGYRDAARMPVDWAVSRAASGDVPVLIHPENYYSRPQARQEMDRLLNNAALAKIPWKMAGGATDHYSAC